MSDNAIVVSIGRNVDGVPMDDSLWLDFQDAIVHALHEHRCGLYFTGTGQGNSGQWGPEEAYTVVAAGPVYSDDREPLLLRLERVRKAYGQEAVAVTEGTTQFV